MAMNQPPANPPSLAPSEPDSDWYCVRCVFQIAAPARQAGHFLYEERLILVQASSFETAIALAEREAEEYASRIEDSHDEYLGMVQAFHLFSDPGHLAEVFSLLRESPLGPDDYLARHFSAGTEHQQLTE